MKVYIQRKHICIYAWYICITKEIIWKFIHSTKPKFQLQKPMYVFFWKWMKKRFHERIPKYTASFFNSNYILLWNHRLKLFNFYNIINMGAWKKEKRIVGDVRIVEYQKLMSKRCGVKEEKDKNEWKTRYKKVDNENNVKWHSQYMT